MQRTPQLAGGRPSSQLVAVPNLAALEHRAAQLQDQLTNLRQQRNSTEHTTWMWADCCCAAAVVCGSCGSIAAETVAEGNKKAGGLDSVVHQYRSLLVRARAQVIECLNIAHSDVEETLTCMQNI